MKAAAKSSSISMCLPILLAALLAGLIAAASASAAIGITKFDGGVFDEGGNPVTQAGSHPYTGSTEFFLTTEVSPLEVEHPTGTLKDAVVEIPAGLIGNPQVVETCSKVLLEQSNACPPESQVGIVTLYSGGFFIPVGSPFPSDYPLFRMEAPDGTAALFGFQIQGVTVFISAKVRTGGDYGVTAGARNATITTEVIGAKATLWGTPADPSHDADRNNCAGNPAPSCSIASTAPRLPLLTLPTSCVGPVETFLDVGAWQGGTAEASFLSHDNATPPNPIGNDGCENVPFTPSVAIAPTSTTADSASGVDARIDVPTDGLLDPDGISQAHLKKAVVTLPEGVSVNPSGAAGLAACSDAQLALGTEGEPSCPEASRIGTVDIQTPLLAADEQVTGEVVLRTPASTDPSSGEMLRMAIVARSEKRGVVVKLPGSATADPVTGRLVATFDQNPQLPFSSLTARFKGGPRGVLAMPQGCGEIATQTVLSPWSATTPVAASTPTPVGGDCSLGFAPRISAGNSNARARGTGTFSFRFSREDGEQWVDGVTAKLPQGLLASVKDLPLCSDGQAAAGNCPAGSRIGTVDATAGSGTPFVLERKGDAYLTQGYKGCAYGLMVKVPVIAGPFDKSSPETDLGDIVVRQAVCVDPTTAQVTVKSDPLPTIWHGIPLRVRSVTVLVDRPGFMLNPSGCSQKHVAATFDSNRGASAGAATPFQASGCAALAFKPRLALRLTGRKQVRTGKHPGVRAVVRQKGVSEAGIEKAVVRLPKSLALDPDNAQALCEFEAGTKADLENHCPKGSIVGRARAKTPLLNHDLVGNVYFVKNVRIDKDTGNAIRTLPMIVVALRGEIAVNLVGESSTTKSGKLVNTFDEVPDAPITQFNLNIRGGSNGILAVTRTRRANINLCAKPRRHIAEADMDGHNGRRYDRNIRMKTPCGKKAKRKAAAKRRAAAKRKAAAKRRASRR